MRTEKLLETAGLLVDSLKIINDEAAKDEEICALYTKIFNSLQIIAEITGERDKLKKMMDDKIGIVRPLAA